LRRFVERFPSSARLGDAKARIATLMQQPEAPSSFADQTFALASLEDREAERLTRQVTRHFRKNTPAIEEAWNIVKSSKDSRVIRRFVDRFPSTQHRVAAQQHLHEMGQELVVQQAPHNLIIRAATDPNVLQCYRLTRDATLAGSATGMGDMSAPECQLALSRFPDIWRYTFDFRFRFALCKSLGDGCNHNMMQDPSALQSVALFDPSSRGIAASSGPNGPNSPSFLGPGSHDPGTPQVAPKIEPKIAPPPHTPNRHAAHHGSFNPKTGGISKLAHTVKLGNFKSTSTLKGHVTLTHVKLGTQSIKLSTIKTPTIKTPTIKTPTINTSAIKTTNVKLPTIRVPNVAVHLPGH
jgi:hypothetical protein